MPCAMAGMQGIVWNNPCPAVEGRQSGDEIERFEDNVRGAVAVGGLDVHGRTNTAGAWMRRSGQLVAHVPAWGERQALLRDRRATDGAAQPFELPAGRVNAYPGDGAKIPYSSYRRSSRNSGIEAD